LRQRRPASETSRYHRRVRTPFLCLLAAVIASCASMRETSLDDPANESPIAAVPPASTSSTARHRQQDSPILPIGRSPIEGPADALVTVVEFGDFQCPYCGRVEPTLHALRERYGDAIRVVWKNAPLPFHRQARLAAEAALEAMAQQGDQGFWRFHDAVFEHQDALDRADLESYAERLGFNMIAFRAALDDHRHAEEIDADLALARLMGVHGTPAFFVNGTPLVGARPTGEFVALADRVLERARTITPSDGAYATMVADPLPSPQTDNAPTRYDVRVNPDAPARGPAQARVVIQLFSDFECPYCARIAPTLDALLQRHPNDLRVVWRDYPLSFHSHAQLAAEAAREVLAQGGSDRFWRYAALLFANQRTLERADLERYAMSVGGIDMDRFRDALDRHAHAAAVRADADAADATGAEIGTPAMFINGHFVAGALPLEMLDRIVQLQLGVQ
jgi:protein-disulfide isomerase